MANNIFPLVVQHPVWAANIAGPAVITIGTAYGAASNAAWILVETYWAELS